MNRKIYRLCLIMLIVAGVLGGFLYYRLEDRKEPELEKGIFVKSAGYVQSIRWFGDEVRQYEG